MIKQFIRRNVLSLDIIKNNSYIILARAFKSQMNTFLNPHIGVNVYAKELNAIHISLAKSGTSSVRSLLLKKIGEDYDENNYDTIHKKVREIFIYLKKREVFESNNTYKFTFVRNPFDRLVSCYKNKILEEDYWFIQKGYVEWFYKGMPFSEFAKSVCRIPDFFSDKHFRSQYSYLYYKDNLIVDYLGKFENMSSDFQAIKEKLSLDDLPHINKAADNTDFRDYYTPELVDIVYNRYKDDVIMFDYIDDYNKLKQYVSEKEPG